MTAVLPYRVPAGLPTGGRFAPKACRNAYLALDALAAAADEDALPAGWTRDPANPQRVLLPWSRCPHGHVAPWAIAACSDCHPGSAPAPGGSAVTCTGRTAVGDCCGRRTTRLDSTGRAACHQHGGRPTP